MSDPLINDRITAILLRYFRQGERPPVVAPAVRPLRDLDLLRLHWAFSDDMMRLCEYIVANRHEVQASLEYRATESNGTVRGRIDATRTLIRRLQTGNQALTVCREPSRSLHNGQNRVLAWVIQHAAVLLTGARDIIPPAAQYHSRLSAAAGLVSEVRRGWVIEQVAAPGRPLPRPSAADLRQAAASRRILYQRAFSAFRTLAAVESGEPEVIAEVLNQTLIGPLETWRRFEMLTAFCAAEALATVTGAGVEVSPLLPGSDGPVLRVGPYDVYWQSRTEHYVEPEQEPSEARVSAILEAYSLGEGGDRPDVVICHRVQGRVAAIAEAKFYQAGEVSAREGVRDAVNQLVRYARGYPDENQDELLGRCLCALGHLPEHLVGFAPPATVPFAASLQGMLGTALTPWAQRVHAAFTQ